MKRPKKTHGTHRSTRKARGSNKQPRRGPRQSKEGLWQSREDPRQSKGGPRYAHTAKERSVAPHNQQMKTRLKLSKQYFKTERESPLEEPYQNQENQSEVDAAKIKQRRMRRERE
jgi:hypothetical protein